MCNTETISYCCLVNHQVPSSSQTDLFPVLVLPVATTAKWKWWAGTPNQKNTPKGKNLRKKHSHRYIPSPPTRPTFLAHKAHGSESTFPKLIRSGRSLCLHFFLIFVAPWLVAMCLQRGRFKTCLQLTFLSFFFTASKRRDKKKGAALESTSHSQNSKLRMYLSVYIAQGGCQELQTESTEVLAHKQFSTRKRSCGSTS